MASTKSQRRIWIIAIVIAGLVLGGALAVYFNSKDPAPRPAGPFSGPVVVEVAEVIQTDLEDVVTAVGSLRASESVMLKAEISGRVAAIGFSDGARVKKGQELIRFDAAVQKAQADQAQAERDLAAARLRRTQELFDRSFLSAASLDDARANLAIAQARAELALATLEKMSLRAPFDGQIGIRNVSVGDFVKDGAELVNVESVNAMKVDFRVPERFAGRLRLGQTLGLRSDAIPNKEFTARVVALDAAVDVSGRSLLVRAVLDEFPPQLRPGMFVRVRLVLEVRKQALVVPEEAIVAAQGAQGVIKVVEGKAVRQRVQTGLRTMVQQKAVVEIVKGLSPGDVVITAGQIKIRGDNAAVKIAPPPAKRP
jgi:membrane fusion protein (multidrug efflux system)